MRILSIESSCDETSAAVVETTPDGGVNLLSQSTATSLALHSKTGGIIPEVAAREQSKFIIPVIQETLEKAGLNFGSIINNKSSIINAPAIDAIAVTYGPGLIGSLLVGVETAKTLAYLWDKPLIPVNHLFGHIYANWLTGNESGVMSYEKNKKIFSAHHPSPITHNRLPEFPAIALVVSGGHTDLVLMKSHTDITWLGGTRDDAAGECFDKSGRLLGFGYPAGPEIERHAKLGNPKTYHFPRPLKHDDAWDFSFSGLKTAVLREVTQLRHEAVEHPRGEENLSLQSNTSGVRQLPDPIVNDICRGLQDAIIDVLVSKTLQAAEKYQVKSILLSGGVAANTTLREEFQNILNTKYQILDTTFFAPAKNLCTDNAAMIGAAAIFRKKEVPWQDVAANPELYFD